jgi:ribosomal protein L19E
MLMLYRAGAAGATIDELASWLRIVRRKDHLRTRLRALDGDKLVLHHPDGRYYITDNGVRYVDKKNLARPV